MAVTADAVFLRAHVFSFPRHEFLQFPERKNVFSGKFNPKEKLDMMQIFCSHQIIHSLFTNSKARISFRGEKEV